MGSQSQLNYLPEKQTDFVFTMIGEEFGFIGNLVCCLPILSFSCLVFLSHFAPEPLWSTIMHRHISHVVFICFCEHWHGHRFVACSWCAASFNFLWRHSYVDCLYWAGTSCECGNSSASS